MRVLRLLTLAAVLAIAYFAQVLFDRASLAGFYPPQLLDFLPFLTPTTTWLSNDLHTLGLWLLAVAAIGFGLLAPTWVEDATAGAGAGRADRPRRSWIWLAVILAAAALMLAWAGTALPVRVDSRVARMGLQAQALWRTGGFSLFTLDSSGAPGVAYLPAGLTMWAAGDALAGAQALGLIAALATVGGTWLVGSELFRRRGSSGQGMAILAAGLTLACVALLHFGRLAPFLPATAVGTFAGWALLIGVRTGRRTVLVIGGLLAGLAPLLGRSGIVFVPILLLWWIGLWLHPRAAAPGVRRAGWTDFLLWLGALGVIAAPVAVAWLGAPHLFAAYWQGEIAGDTTIIDLWANLRHTLFTFFWTPDASTVFGGGGHFVGSIVAPLFVLGTAALVLAIDRLVGWCLLTWIGVTILFSSLANLAAPDWPTLLPLIPAVGLTICFALDRIGQQWVDTTDANNDLAAVSLGSGLLVAVAFFTWISFFPFASLTGDPASYTGRALRSLAPDTVAVLAASNAENAVRLDDPIVQYVAGPRAGQALALAATALPASLPPGSVVIVQPQDSQAQSAVRARYPQSQLDVTRDLRSNPRLFVYRIP